MDALYDSESKPRLRKAASRTGDHGVAVQQVAATMPIVVAVLIVAIVTGCGSAGGVPRQRASPLAESRGAASDSPWGPLAVLPGSNAIMEARIVGTLHVTDRCVLIETFDGEVALLVWPADRTTWNSDESVTLQDLDGGAVTMRDGDVVTLGGGGDSAREGGRSGDDWTTRSDWISAPAPSCPDDGWWIVGEPRS